MRKLRKGDPVIVISGKNKGKVSVIESVSGDFVYLKEVNEVKRAMKWQGFIKKVLPLHISTVMYYLKDKKQATRIGFQVDKKGKKVRIAKKTWEVIK